MDLAQEIFEGFPKHHLIAETTLCPEFSRWGASTGYGKQMIIKIAASALAQADFMLTLDADILCIRPFDPGVLLVGGRAPLQLVDRTLHREWWLASAELLQADTNMIEPGMSVTPAILSKEICRGLIGEIQSSTDENWVDFLLGCHEKRWTEYTLYHLYAEKRQLLRKYHTLPNEEGFRRIFTEQDCIWDKMRITSWDPSPSLCDLSRGFFLVLQSNNEIPLDEYQKMLATSLRSKGGPQWLLDQAGEWSAAQPLGASQQEEKDMEYTDFITKYDSEYAGRLDRRADGFRTIFGLLEARPQRNYQILETGCVRGVDNWIGDGQSTVLFNSFLNFYDGLLISVDLSPDAIAVARRITSKKSHFVCSDSIRFLRDLNKLAGNGLKLDLVYLNSFDVDFDNAEPSAFHHIEELLSLGAASKGAILAIDDNLLVNGTWVGKGALVDKYLSDIGIQAIYRGYQFVWQI